MSSVVTRTIFTTTSTERGWRTHVTSAIVHVVIIGAAFLIAFPAMKVSDQPVREHITLLAPPIPRYHPKIASPHLPRLITRATKIVAPPLLAKSIPPPILAKPQPQQVARTVVPPPAPSAPKIQTEIKAESKPNIPAPKAIIKTGMFQEAQIAKAVPVPHQLAVGGFGDPHGVQPSETPKPAPVMMSKVGTFESPLGAGASGGNGSMQAGAIRQSGFGAGAIASGNSKSAGSIRTGGFGEGIPSGVAGGNGNAPGTVRSVGFGDNTIAAAPQRKEVPSPAIANFTPVEILFKPRPSYSSEARSLRVEGQVSLEVVFQASGSVKVVRVVRGLGHGLDEAAQQAAIQVRFKPATRSGAPVDTNATISITFELS